jgi:hypothetical protein
MSTLKLKLSVKRLKEQRDMLNDLLPNYIVNDLGKRFYITAFGREMNTGEIISIERHTGTYAQNSNANWSYQLVLGSGTGRK